MRHSFTTGAYTICLPGWEQDVGLTTELGSGAAPDGDEDAIVGMIFAVSALASAATKPSWYAEVRAWADASATALYQFETVNDPSGTDFRIVRLGSCWGGWNSNGNNPSYHSPGSYRIMRDYQLNFPSASRTYTLPNPSTLASDWNRVIKTTYGVLSAVQCSDQGMVPNWATIGVSNGKVVSTNGAFANGDPQNEFGADASRTVWRVALDAAVYPELMLNNPVPFMAPLINTLNAGYSPSSPQEWLPQTVSTFILIAFSSCLCQCCSSLAASVYLVYTRGIC